MVMKKIMIGKKIYFPIFLASFVALLPKNLVHLTVLFYIILSINWININVNSLKDRINTIKYFFLIIIPGLVIGISNQSWDYFRDVMNYMSPILIFMIGYNWGKKISLNQFYFSTIFAAFLISIVKIFTINTYLEDSFFNHNYLLVMGLFFLLIRKKDFDLKLSILQKLFYCIPLFTCLVMIDQRGLFIGLIILLLFSTGFFRVSHKINIKLFLSSLSIFLTLFVGILFFLNNNPKIGESFNEIVPNNYTTKEEINFYWRGFESYKGLVKFSNYNSFHKLFGAGFGELTPIGFSMKLNNYTTTSIPHFHNFYTDILVKTGIIGLLGFLIFIFS